jgi:transcriptional regulator with XRE-family HTH domain
MFRQEERTEPVRLGRLKDNQYEEGTIMTQRSPEVSIKSDVLVWARESIGRSIGQVAGRLHVSENLVTRWESGDKNPTLNQVRTLAGYYKRPLAAFFLPEPPEEPPPPKDFRTLPGEDTLPLSPKTRLALRRARRLQSLTKELNGDLPGHIADRIGSASLSDDPESLAAEVRNRFGVTSQVQFGWEKDIEALDQWREQVERQGVLVFQMSWPLEDARAFSIADGDIPVIVPSEPESFPSSMSSATFSSEREGYVTPSEDCCGQLVVQTLTPRTFVLWRYSATISRVHS